MVFVLRLMSNTIDLQPSDWEALFALRSAYYFPGITLLVPSMFNTAGQDEQSMHEVVDNVDFTTTATMIGQAISISCFRNLGSSRCFDLRRKAATYKVGKRS